MITEQDVCDICFEVDCRCCVRCNVPDCGCAEEDAYWNEFEHERFKGEEL